MLLTADAAYTLDHWNEKALLGFLTSTIDAVRSVPKLHHVVRQSGAQVVFREIKTNQNPTGSRRPALPVTSHG
jgi:hypothetical protein